MAIQRRICSLWLVLICACTGSSDSQPIEPKAVYEKNCVLCHGLDGKKGFAGAGDLTESKMSLQEIKNIILNGKNENPGKIMTPFKDVLTNAEIEAVANYVLNIRE